MQRYSKKCFSSSFIGSKHIIKSELLKYMYINRIKTRKQPKVDAVANLFVPLKYRAVSGGH